MSSQLRGDSVCMPNLHRQGDVHLLPRCPRRCGHLLRVRFSPRYEKVTSHFYSSVSRFVLVSRASSSCVSHLRMDLPREDSTGNSTTQTHTHTTTHTGWKRQTERTRHTQAHTRTFTHTNKATSTCSKKSSCRAALAAAHAAPNRHRSTSRITSGKHVPMKPVQSTARVIVKWSVNWRLPQPKNAPGSQIPKRDEKIQSHPP